MSDEKKTAKTETATHELDKTASRVKMAVNHINEICVEAARRKGVLIKAASECSGSTNWCADYEFEFQTTAVAAREAMEFGKCLDVEVKSMDDGEQLRWIRRYLRERISYLSPTIVQRLSFTRNDSHSGLVDLVGLAKFVDAARTAERMLG